MPKVVGNNVIGEIRGSSNPDQYITVGGHLDSWDLAEGAHDDGAGCVQSMELIRVYKKLKIVPKNTIRIVLFADEENGGAGADKYAELAKQKNEKLLFALESDDGGFVPRAFRFNLEEGKIEKFRKWIQESNKNLNVNFIQIDLDVGFAVVHFLSLQVLFRSLNDD